MGLGAAPVSGLSRFRGRVRLKGWFLPAVLLAVYLLIKLQGWGYARQVHSLQQQLDELRPALSTKVFLEQCKATVRAYEGIADQIRRRDQGGVALLEMISMAPPSVTLERLEAHTSGMIRLQGFLLAGQRPPESVLVPWAGRLAQGGEAGIRIRKLAPSVRGAGFWDFELERTAAHAAP